MNVYEAATSRRSIRKFKDVPLPYEALRKCVNAGRLAPSGLNRQPCEFLVVDDEQLLPEVFDSISSWAGQPKPKGTPLTGSEPKAYIVILTRGSQTGAGGNNGAIAYYDAAMAAENIMLVALEEGIGSCPLRAFRENELRQLLKVPDTCDIALVVAMGYPDERPVVETTSDTTQRWVDDQGVRHIPKRKLEDILHRNTFQPREG